MAAIRVLAVEDDREQREAVQAYLARPGFDFALTLASSLGEAFAKLDGTEFDVVLLDLNLPDSSGFATLDAMRARTDTPIVVLTGAADPDLTREVMHRGAQDYVPKDSYSGRLLGRALYYTAERRRLQAEVATAREEASQLREARALGAVGQARLSVTAELLGERPLRQSDAAAFAGCVERFREAIRHGMTAQTYRRSSVDPRGGLAALADTLGSLRATPPDIIELYREVIATAAGRPPGTSEVAWREEARLMLIGLLGHVLSFYRLRAAVERVP